MTDSGEDLEPIGLEALTASPAVPVTPSRELMSETLGIDRHARGHALEDSDQRPAVGLAGREHAEHPPIIGNAPRRPLAGKPVLGSRGAGAAQRPPPLTGDRSPRGRAAGARRWCRVETYFVELAQSVNDSSP